MHTATDGCLLSHLVGKVSEVGMDEAILILVYDLKVSSRKSKSSSSKKTQKVNKKAKMSQSPFLSQ
jgi:hypothetical protein